LTAVLVSHPHVAAVSLGLATTLSEVGKLAGYFTGVAFTPRSLSGRIAALLAAKQPVIRNRILPNVPPSLLHGSLTVEVSARLASRALAGVDSRFKLYNALFAAHDAVVARRRWPVNTTAIYAYEDGALQTFQRAARHGLERIWDLPLPHYRTIERILREEANRWPDAPIGPPHREPEWKQRRKDAELALATQISVASQFTKQSLDGVAPAVPIVIGPYGFPIAEFAPRPAPPTGRFRVLSVGTHDLRKGTPYLLEAWKRAAIPDAELHLVGPLRMAKVFVDRYAGLFEHWPHAPKSELGARYAAADLLAFPTLGDGFGLVIQEAMSCGTPVVTTPCGGGPECITDGVDGWIVPPRDIDALVARLRACASDRDATARIGRAARARAERWTWRQATESMVRDLGL
jgi:glycosyltransferase involved in cell wall biosynthesis